MDHAEARSGELALRYLRGRLAPDEEASFEEHLVGCPECAEELELLERFDRAVKGAAAEDVLALSQGVQGARRAHRRRRLRLAAGLAGGALACVLVALVVAFGLRSQRLEQAVREARAPVANPLVVRLSPTRGPGDEPSVALHPRPGADWVVLELDAAGLGSEGGPVEAAVRDPAGTVVLRVDGLVPGPRNALTLALPVDRLPAGDHRLEVRNGGRVLTFPFRMVRAEGAPEGPE